MIAVRVVAVPERLERAERLARSLGGQVVLDANHDGTFPNHVRALRSIDKGSHAVILEDDAIPCADFVDHVARLIAQRPEHLLGLYVGRNFPKGPQPALTELVKSSPEWLDHPQMTSHLWWAVGYVMPVADIPAVLAHLEGRRQHAWIDTDKRLGRWHAHCGRLSYPFPSPVDHDDDLPSITSHSGHGRTAWEHCRGGAQ